MTGGGNSSGGSASEGDGGDASRAGAPANAGVWADFAAAFCRAARSCCEADGFGSTELQECEADAERQFDVIEGIERGAVVVTDQLPSCVAQLSALADECVFDPDIQQACNAAFAGTVAPAGECVNVLDCAHDDDAVVCIRIEANGVEPTSGTCRRLQPAALGERCLVTVSARPYGVTHTTNETDPPLTYCDTESDLYCSLDTGTCESLGAPGTPCTTVQGCQSGLVCVETCQEPKQPGEGCSSSSECLAPARCVEGQCGTPRFASEQLCGGDLN